jgi:hypothetical protein
LAAGLAAALLAAAAVVALSRPPAPADVAAPAGVVALQSDVPWVRLVVERDGAEAAVLDPAARPQAELLPGEYTVKVKVETREDRKPPEDSLSLSDERFALGAGERRVVVVRRMPKPNAPPDEWRAAVARLPAQDQVRAVDARLARIQLSPPRAPVGVSRSRIENGVVVGLTLRPTNMLTEVSPVAALTGLKELTCAGPPTDSPPAMFLSLAGLRGLKLTKLNCSYLGIRDLSPLRNMPLTDLECNGAPVTDLRPLAGLPLTRLDVGDTRVRDLSPLKGMKLVSLHVEGAKVDDLSVLRGMPLTELHCERTGVVDFSAVAEAPLKEFWFDFKPERDGDLLRGLKTLEVINGMPTKKFFETHDLGP